MAINVLDIGVIQGNLDYIDNGSVLTSYLHGKSNITIYIPSGYYYFKTPIIINGSTNIKIYGDKTTYLLNYKNLNQPIIYISNATGNTIDTLNFMTDFIQDKYAAAPLVMLISTDGDCKTNTINNCNFYAQNTTASNNALILLDGLLNTKHATTNNTITNCKLYGNNRIGVGISNCRAKYTTIKNCYIIGTGLECITVDNISDNATIQNNTLLSSQGGCGTISIDNSDYCTIQYNTIDGDEGQNGIITPNEYTEEYITSQGGTSGNQFLIIDNNIIKNCTIGIAIKVYNTVSFGLEIKYNTVSNSTTGIYVQKPSNGIVIENNGLNYNVVGINIEDVSLQFSVDSNTFNSNQTDMIGCTNNDHTY